MDYIQFYTQRREEFQARFDQHRASLRRSSFLRLLVFILTIAGIYLLWHDWRLAATIAVAGFAGFTLLVSRHTNLKRERDFLAALIQIQEEELKIGARNYLHRDDGSRFLRDDHEYSRDIDLYGSGSIFQYLNRTITAGGGITLARKLNAEETPNQTKRSSTIEDKPLAGSADSIEEPELLTAQQVRKRQNAVREMAGKIEFCQQFQATASLLDQEQDPEHFLRWIQDYRTFVPGLYQWLPYAIVALNAVLFTLYMLEVVNGYAFAAGFFLGLGITGRFVKKINAFSAQVSKLELFFEQYSQLILRIENEKFNSTNLKELQSNITGKSTPASTRLGQLAQYISRLDQRNNMLFGVLANGLGLWDLKQVHNIEKWITSNAGHVELWISTVAEIDAINSLGTFAFNHQNYIYPQILDGDFKLHANGAAHPLLDPDKAVGNDINIATGEFFIITGANMAGKSTFLRTVALKIVLSNAGLPVYATSMTYSPISLITSMRTSDSLTDDASYFFSELKRLKYIVDKIAEAPYFIVLDEILKGTNSQDKANGSRKLIEKLSRNNATGIIATHDLSLTEVAGDFNNISNYFFDADITNDVLTFDYTFKRGVAQNMNASFLLRKMGIVDE
ncbi:MAG: DNA mismatch repair protein MutS [Nonlabens sp.]